MVIPTLASNVDRECLDLKFAKNTVFLSISNPCGAANMSTIDLHVRIGLRLKRMWQQWPPTIRDPQFVGPSQIIDASKKLCVFPQIREFHACENCLSIGLRRASGRTAVLQQARHQAGHSLSEPRWVSPELRADTGFRHAVCNVNQLWIGREDHVFFS